MRPQQCVFIGHGRFGAKGLERILTEFQNQIQVISVYQDLLAFESPHWDDPYAVGEIARRFSIPIFEGDFVSSGYLEHVKMRAPDFGLIMRCPRKLPADLLHLPRLGFFNMHASDLPKYQGVAPLQYAMVNENEICLTVHQVTEQFDCGDILLKSKMAPIQGKFLEDVFSLMVDLGKETVGEVLHALSSGAPVLRRQDLSLRSPATKKGLEKLLALDFENDSAEFIYRKMLARGRTGNEIYGVPVQVLGFEKNLRFEKHRGELMTFDGLTGMVVNGGVVFLEFQRKPPARLTPSPAP